ncbi:MAG: DNA glycosylase family protein [Sulfobacillus sp.]
MEQFRTARPDDFSKQGVEEKGYLPSAMPEEVRALLSGPCKWLEQPANTLPPPFAALVSAIVGQRISYKIASKIRQALFRKFNGWTTPEGMSELNPSEVGLNQKKYAVIKELAERWLSARREASAMKLEDCLSIKGIGPWTIEIAKLFARADGWMDAYPPKDVSLLRAYAKFIGARADFNDLNAFMNRHRGYRGLLCLHLWQNANES